MLLALCAMCVHVTLAVLLLIAAIAALVRFRGKSLTFLSRFCCVVLFAEALPARPAMPPEYEDECSKPQGTVDGTRNRVMIKLDGRVAKVLTGRFVGRDEGGSACIACSAKSQRIRIKRGRICFSREQKYPSEEAKT